MQTQKALFEHEAIRRIEVKPNQVQHFPENIV